MIRSDHPATIFFFPFRFLNFFNLATSIELELRDNGQHGNTLPNEASYYQKFFVTRRRSHLPDTEHLPFS